MIFLILNIICSALLYVIFRYFEKFKIDNLSAIIYNYLTAVCMGVIFSNHTDRIFFAYKSNWFLLAAGLGIVFITVFLIMAKSAQSNGISVTSIANKMSLIIPVVFGIILYNEALGIKKISGIIIALAAIVLVSARKENQTKAGTNYLWLILIFLGSGTIDTLMKYAEHKLLCSCETTAFISIIFLFAALLGITWKLVAKENRKELYSFKNIVAGLLLGIPNYGSIYFLMRALNESELESSVLYPYNNIGTILMSISFGLILFKERYSFLNYLGMLLAVLGVILISL